MWMRTGYVNVKFMCNATTECGLTKSESDPDQPAMKLQHRLITSVFEFVKQPDVEDDHSPLGANNGDLKLTTFKLQNIFAFGKSGPPNLGILKVKSADSKGGESRNESNDMCINHTDKVHGSALKKNIEKLKKIESIRKVHQRHLLAGAVKTDSSSLNRSKVEKLN